MRIHVHGHGHAHLHWDYAMTLALPPIQCMTVVIINDMLGTSLCAWKLYHVKSYKL